MTVFAREVRAAVGLRRSSPHMCARGTNATDVSASFQTVDGAHSVPSLRSRIRNMYQYLDSKVKTGLPSPLRVGCLSRCQSDVRPVSAVQTMILTPLVCPAPSISCGLFIILQALADAWQLFVCRRVCALHSRAAAALRAGVSSLLYIPCPRFILVKMFSCCGGAGGCVSRICCRACKHITRTTHGCSKTWILSSASRVDIPRVVAVLFLSLSVERARLFFRLACGKPSGVCLSPESSVASLLVHFACLHLQTAHLATDGGQLRVRNVFTKGGNDWQQAALSSTES